MKLPVPVLADGKMYDTAKLKEATAGTIAATRSEAASGSVYSAVLEWCAGVVSEISGPDGVVTDTSEVRRLIRFMSFNSAYAIACLGMAETKGDDAVPGAYPCPRCGQVVSVGQYEEDGEEVDTSDHLLAIEYDTVADPSGGVEVVLSNPVELRRKDNGELIEAIGSVLIDWPTLGQCIRAHQRYPDDETKMQFAVFAEALRSVNGAKPVTPSWRATYGDLVFSRMPARDMTALQDKMKKYSMSTKKERACMKCKNRWSAEIDLNGFFSSGLGT